MTDIEFGSEIIGGKLVPLQPDQVPFINIYCKNGHYLTAVRMQPFIKIIKMYIQCLKCDQVTTVSDLYMEYKGKVEQVRDEDLK